jgi:hypothetical protein
MPYFTRSNRRFHAADWFELVSSPHANLLSRFLDRQNDAGQVATAVVHGVDRHQWLGLILERPELV